MALAKTKRFNLSQMNMLETHATLTEILHGLESIDQKAKANQKYLTAYLEFEKSGATSYLRRAQERLEKKGFNVGFAGTFSGGKSTLINAVLREPGLLAAEAGECTMSITTVAAPPEGHTEEVVIKYYSESDALQYVLSNKRYQAATDKHSDILGDEFNTAAAREVLKATINDLNAGEPEDKQKARELDEFVEALVKYADRLNGTYRDSLENAYMYLTVDKDSRGMGHLLCIEQVNIYKNNPLFVEKGVKIVDLPGTDAVNDRQIELTHNYLREADAVILVVEPRGFAKAHTVIVEIFGKQFHQSRDKIYIAVNKFDTLKTMDLEKDKIERLYTQFLDVIQSMKLDPERLYFTDGLFVELKTKKERGLGLNSAEEAEFNQQVETLKDMTRILDEQEKVGLKPVIVDLIRKVVDDGGVSTFRDNLMGYLERDIQVNRLREIYQDLANANHAVDGLLAPEKGRIQEIVANIKSQAKQINEFLEKLEEEFIDTVAQTKEALQPALGQALDSARSKFLSFVEKKVKDVNFQRIKAKLNIPAPRRLKQEVIQMLKDDFSKQFGDMVQAFTVQPVYDRIAGHIAESKIPKVLDEFAKTLGIDYTTKLDSCISNFLASLKVSSQMRALEEAWNLEEMALDPGADVTWTKQVEETFRKDLIAIFTDRFSAYIGRLNKILWRYHSAVIDSLVTDFQNLTNDLQRDLKGAPDNISLPMNIFADVDDEEQKKDFVLADIFKVADSVGQNFTKLSEYFELLETNR
jgi:GTP-binding protein EngB required for normal cell division